MQYILKDDRVIATYPDFQEVEDPQVGSLLLYSAEALKQDEITVVDRQVVRTPVLQELTYQQLLDSLRWYRNKALSKTDWAVLPDSPLDQSLKDAVTEYRQDLRDITEPVKSGEKTADEITLPDSPI